MKLFLLAALVAAVPSPAKACSAPVPCYMPQFVPADGATVPANLPGIVWWAPAYSQSADPTLVELRDDAGNQVALTYSDGVFVPAAPLVADTHYTLTDANPCVDTPRTSRFTTTAEAPLPTALGQLVGTNASVAVFEIAMPASCTTDIAANEEGLKLTLDASALPWKDALLFGTQLDGSRYTALGAYNQIVPPGSSWIGRGIDLVYAACSPPPDGAPHFETDEGDHVAVMTASLAGTTLALTSTSAQFALSCAVDTGPTDGDGGGGGCSTGGGFGAASLLILLALRRSTRSSAR